MQHQKTDKRRRWKNGVYSDFFPRPLAKMALLCIINNRHVHAMLIPMHVRGIYDIIVLVNEIVLYIFNHSILAYEI